MVRHVEIYRRAGEYAGWPANYGLWIWDDEAVVVFTQGFHKASDGMHSRDKSRSFVTRQARSRDGGLTWKIDAFAGSIPGGETLSGDEHVEPELQSGPRISASRDLEVNERPIDFLAPDTAVMAARTDLHAGALSWFYVTRDRAASWDGPFRLGDFGLRGISARTDIVPLGSSSALFMLSGAKSDGREGRVFCVRTDDGGQSFTFIGFVDDEPDGYAIMPASVMLSDGSILTAIRRASPRRGSSRKCWIDLYRSGDEGRSWRLVGTPVPDAGQGGNPPTLTRLPDERLVLVYGYRAAPFGVRARVSADAGGTWSEDLIVRADGGTPDLGYPRTVLRPDGALLTAYYFNRGADDERHIAASIFRIEDLTMAAA